jgi:DNA-directed RNA polymerase specialized sigma24 family protein
MAADGSVTRWIDTLKAGDRDAAQALWNAYFQRLVVLARARLRGTARRAADEEDVALSAFDSFFRGVERGRFPRLNDRDDLWRLLFVITVRKASNLAKFEGRQARGSGRVWPLSALAEPGAAEAIGNEPSPELAAQVADECRRLLARLPSDALREIALWKMEGFTNEEIAAQLGCVRFTIDRKLRTIRQIWAGQAAEP